MKNFSCLLTILIAMGGVLSASAFPVTFKWNIPGAAEIKSDSYQSEVVLGPASDTDTEFTYECESSGWMYLVAKDGYKISSAEINGEAVKPGNYDGYIYVGKFVTSESAFNVTLAPIERTSEISVDVENGAWWISTSFNNGYSVPLKNGMNTVKYDPELEKSLTFTAVNGASDFYKITLNGVELEKRSGWNAYYYIPELVSGDKVVIRVFEGEEPVLKDCVVKISLPEGLEDCIYSIRNWTTNNWETLDNGEFVVNKGTDIQVNFKGEDFTYTKFTLNGVDVTSDYKRDSLRFIVDEDTELVVEGYPTDFNDMIFTAYVMNPEGVVLYREQYLSNPADLTGGEAVEDDIILGGSTGIVLTAAETRKFEIPVSMRSPNIYIAAKEGWYVCDVEGLFEGEMSQLPSITSETTTFYVVAKPLDNYCTASFDVQGASEVRLTASTVKSNLWGNPANTFTLTEGVQQVKFIPDYDLPFSLRYLEQVANFGVYLDGMPLNADENNTYSITPWYPTDGAVQTVESTVTVNATGTPARTSRVKMEEIDDVTAEIFYSPIRHDLNAEGQTLLAGTMIIVKPTNIDTTIAVNDEVVNGLGDNDKFINGLNDAGEYVFEAPAGNVTVVISKGCGITGVNGVSAASMTGKIYTIDGREINAGISTLPKGIYIVDGKKIAIH